MTRAAPFRSTHAGDNGYRSRPGFRPFDWPDAESSLGARFREIALRRDDAVALVDGPVRRSYRELLARSNAIATGLHERLGDARGAVAILLPFGIPLVESILGILLARRAYAVLDPSAPDAHLARLLAAAAPSAIVCDSETRRRLGEFAPDAERRLVSVEELSSSKSLRSIPDEVAPDEIACLFGTSGSTGTPKLVALSHRAVLFDIGRQTNDLYLGPDDRFDLLFSFAFSASLAPLFGAILNGGELHLLDLRQGLPVLADWLAKHGITISTMTVSTLRTLCEQLRGPDACPELRLLSVGGEALLSRDVEAFRNIFASSCVLQNAMAATETRTYAQYFVPNHGCVADPLPIGWPVAGKEMVLLDETGAPIHDGRPGEITVRSRYIASGYVENGELLLGARFAPTEDGNLLYRTGDRGQFRDDGCLLYLGRNDALVKIRGYRVELGEVESALSRHPAVRRSAVLVQEDVPGEPRLVAYVVPDETRPLAISELAHFLRQQLPEYMVPSVFVPLKTFPLTPNGKIDRRALPLPAPSALSADDSVLYSEIEVQIAAIWQESLQVERVGLDDDFFELGGHSLLAARIIARIQQAFHVFLPMSTMFEASTVRRLSVSLLNARHSTNRTEFVPLQPNGSRPPLYLLPGMSGDTVYGRALLPHLAPNQPVFGIETRWAHGEAPTYRSFEEMAARYATDLCAFQSQGPFCLAGYSFAGLLAYETARQLAARGREVAFLGVVDIGPPGTPDRSVLDMAKVATAFLRNLPVWYLATLPRLSASEFVRRIRQRLIAWRAGRRRPFRTGKTRCDLEVADLVDVARLPNHVHDQITLSLRAYNAYVAGRFPGTVTLYSARVRPLFSPGRDDHCWATLAASVDLRFVPGDHESLFLSPNVRILAEMLQADLDRLPQGKSLPSLIAA